MQEIFLSKVNSILTVTMCHMLLLLPEMVFFGGMHVFLPLKEAHSRKITLSPP
jgi:hypothetical protein